MDYSNLTCLTEKNLIDYLLQIYPNSNWLYNKQFPGFKFKPDYRCEELKICVEFDGPRHYTKGKVVADDIIKTDIMKNLGYTVIRIPMYVQLDKRTVKALFDVDLDITNNYPHGFIQDTGTMVFPADFCPLGITRFHNELNGHLNCIKEEVYKSVFNKAMNCVDSYLSWAENNLPKDLYEEQYDDFDHVANVICLKYMDYDILSQTQYNDGLYTDKFITSGW